MSEVMTTPSKASKAPHRHTKSETPARSISNPADSYSTPARSNQRRQGRNRNNYDNNQRLAHPNPSASDTALVQGYMSAGHNEQQNGRKSNRFDGSVSDSPAAAMNNKNRRGGRRDRQSTPGQGGSPPKQNGMLAAATPAKDSAYAGPAFHASPAASSLPMPKFFSKSVPANNAPATMQTRLEQESDSSGTSEKSESPPLAGATPVNRILARPQAEQSPLDLFFKADREEKARKASLLSTATPPGKSPAPANARNHMRHASNNNKHGMFNMEMDSGAAIMPKASSPSPAHRMSATRTTSAPSDVPRAAQESESYPQALKDLFSASKKPAAQSPLANGFAGTPPQNGQDFHTPSPFYRPSPGPRQVSGGPRTPAGQINLEANPYYYGNRNLSPLFQAAKGDSAKRSSALRQELDSSPSTHNRVELPVTHSAPLPATPSRPAAGKPDPSAFSRDFLNTHIQQAGMQDSLAAPYTHHPGLRSPFTHTTAADTPRDQSPAADTKLMENDLKRLLKLQLVDT
ncbi:putative proteophosphoglycan 5 [Diplodia seriata]|uniref:Putative proteophosphoglycan 5 n=1 Tax=Diplodia seriata TaxID=420778 RepID=A0A0G2E7H2_9PEZI|nr:putative proteophosphoglycan 5 [Diplodia seriata]